MGMKDLSELSKVVVSGEKDIRRGDIFYISNTVGVTDSEQRAGRPAVIVSSEMGVKTSPVVSIVYLTAEPKPKLSVHVDIFSCDRPSTALCEQVFTVSKSRVEEYRGHVTPAEMKKIETGIAVALGIQQGAPIECDMHLIPEEGDEIISDANSHIMEVLETGEQVRKYNRLLSDIATENIYVGSRVIDDLIPHDVKEEIRNKAVDAIQSIRNNHSTTLLKLIGRLDGGTEGIPCGNTTAIVSDILPGPMTPPSTNQGRKGRKGTLPSNMTLEAVSRMYVDECKTAKEIGLHFGVKETAVKNFIYRHEISRNPKRESKSKSEIKERP